jgi:hypothetical protein
MDVFLDYETICVNCKEKGYSFGYAIKTIEYKNQIVMDLPQQYLNGPCLSFRYQNIPILIRSLENSHQMGVAARKPLFSMINAKLSSNNTISRFTYFYSLQNHPQVKAIDLPPETGNPGIYEYVDIYRFEDKPYILLYYSFRNSTSIPLINFKFYNFYDFDIFGQDQFDLDMAEYDQNLQVIFQYDKRDEKGDLFAGFGSTLQNFPTKYECNASNQLMISMDSLNLRNINVFGPDDCAIALQWDLASLNPEKINTFPIMLVFGNGKEEFIQNVVEARNHLEKLLPGVKRAVKGKTRLIIDPKLEKLAFSTKKWCKVSNNE